MDCISLLCISCSRITGERRTGFSRGAGGLKRGGGDFQHVRSHKCIRAYCTRGARSRRRWGWRGRRRWGERQFELEDDTTNELEPPHG